MNKIYNIKSDEKNKRAAKYIIVSVLTVVIIIFSTLAANAADTIIKNEKVQIDVTESNKTGTVKINMLEKTDKKIKVEITKSDPKDGDKKYTYDLNGEGKVESYPLQWKNGEYGIRVMIESAPKKYAVGLATKYKLELSDKDANAPFMNTNQLVNYNKDSKIVKKAKELADKQETELGKVEAIYEFVIDSMDYDTKKATNPPAGYVPNVDEVVAYGKGICFDYAAVFAAMLRSQGIPAKLVMGWVKTPNGDPVYHAWNEFYLKDKGGWFKINEMKFDGKKFERVDPTFESNNKANKGAIKFIGDGSNYSMSYEF